MARRTLLLIASVLMAALGTALIWLYVEGAENRAQQNADLVPAVFLVQDLKAGASPQGLVTVRKVPTSVAAGAVTSISELGVKKLTIDAHAGEVLLRSMLGTAAAPGTRFPAGGAASVTINDPNRVPTDLRLGDSVDIVELDKDGARLVTGLSDVTVRTLGTVGQAVTGTAMVSGTTGAPANGAIPATIVGLNVTSEQAVTLYGIVARGNQVAIYLHDPRSR